MKHHHYYGRKVAAVMGQKKFDRSTPAERFQVGAQLYSANMVEKELQQSRRAEARAAEEASKRLRSGVCPQCGGYLVRRTARQGKHAGSEFLGCSRFPDCRYTENL